MVDLLADFDRARERLSKGPAAVDPAAGRWVSRGSASQHLGDSLGRAARAVGLDRQVVDLTPDLLGDRGRDRPRAVALSKSISRPAR